MAARPTRRKTGYGSSHEASDRSVGELDRALREEAEAIRWAKAAEDPEFRTEATHIAAAFDEVDRSPA